MAAFPLEGGQARVRTIAAERSMGVPAAWSAHPTVTGMTSITKIGINMAARSEPIVSLSRATSVLRNVPATKIQTVKGNNGRSISAQEGMKKPMTTPRASRNELSNGTRSRIDPTLPLVRASIPQGLRPMCRHGARFEGNRDQGGNQKMVRPLLGYTTWPQRDAFLTPHRFWEPQTNRR